MNSEVMSGPRRTQCLVFVLRSGCLKGRNRPTKVTSREEVEAFALLPHTVKRDHPEVLALFSQNGVVVVDSDSEYPALYSGVKNNEVELLEMLLDEDGEVYGSDTKSSGCLHVAVRTNNCKLSKLLFPNRITVHPQTKFNTSNLRTAIDEQSHKFLEQLLANGTGVSYRRSEGGTLLHFAVEQYHELLLALLLKAKADVNCYKKDGWTPLHIAADKGYTRITEQLLQNKAEIDSVLTSNSQLRNATPLQLAVKKGHIDIVRILLEHGANVDAYCSNGETVLQLAIEKGCLESVDQVLKHRPDLSNRSNYEGFRLAVNETRLVYRDITRKLTDYGFKVSPEDVNNFAMLRGAVRLNCIPIVRQFLQHDIDLNDHERHSEIRSLLHVAVEHSGEEMVKLLLENGAHIESNCYYLKRTPIFAAAGRGRLDNMKILLQSGSRVDVRDIFGLTALLVSSENGHPETVEALLESGAEPNTVCEKGRSALFYAVMNGHVKVAEVLSRYGATSNVMDVYRRTPLHIASTKGQSELVEILLRNNADVDVQCLRGKTALWLAAEKGHLKIVEQLLEYNALVDCKAEYGMTPLHVVARLGSSEIAEVLLKKNADVNATCLKRRTPLFYAVVGGHLDVVKVLLKCGADTDLNDVDHKTALYAAAVERSKALSTFEDAGPSEGISSHATVLKSESVVELLLKFGARLDFILRSKPVVFDLAVFSSTAVFKTLLEFCFLDSELFDEARVCEIFDPTLHLVYLGSKLGHFTKAGDVFAKHVIKVRALRLNNETSSVAPIWHCKTESIDEFAKKCEKELSLLKREQIGNTSVSLYDVLTKDSCRIAGYLRNSSIDRILKLRSYRVTFPIYAGIIDCQFLKGNLRKELFQLCIKACHLRSNHFRTLPYDLKERVFSYVRFGDLKNLLRACGVPLTIG